MTFDVEDWYNKICSGDVIVSHKGSISADLITKTLVNVEDALSKQEDRKKVRKKVYNVLVEALQNLYHHALNVSSGIEINNNEDKFAMFVLKKDEQYSFISGNYVLPKHVQILKDRLDQINRLTPAQLKTLYQLILNNNEYSDKGGGGLGFVDIARRAGCRYEYKFHKLNNDVYFFNLKIMVVNV